MSASLSRRVTGRLFRITGWLIVAILLLSVILITALVTLIRSEQGSAWLIHTAVERFVDQGHVGSVSGSLGRGLTIEDFRGAFGDTTVALDTVEVRVAWTALLWQSRLDIAYLVTEGLTIHLPASEEAAVDEPPQTETPPGPWPSIRLPIDIHVARLQLTDTVIAIGEAEHRLHYAGLRASLTPVSLDVEELHVQYEDISASLMGRIGTSFPYRNDLRLDWQFDAQEPWSGRARIHGDLGALQLEHRLVGVVVVDTDASVRTGLQAESMAADLEAMAADLSNVVRVADFTIEGLESPLNAQLHLDLNGTAQHWALDIAGSAELGDHPPLSLAAAGTGDLEQFALHSLILGDGSGELHAEGDIRWTPELAAQLNVAIDALELSAWLPQADLSLDGRLALDLRQVEGAPAAKVVLEPLEIAYDELQVTATGDLAWSPQRMAIDDLQVVADGNHLTVSAFMEGEELGAQWQLQAPRLATLGEGFGGQLSSTGRVEGSLKEPRARISLRGQGVVVPGLTLDTVELSAQPQHQGQDQDQTDHQIHLAVAGLSVGDTQVDRVDVDLTGALEQHTLAVDAAMQEESLTLRLSGGYQDESWRGRFETLTLDTSVVGRWQMQEPTTAVYTPDAVTLDPLCLHQRDSHLCLSAAQSIDQALQVNVELEHFPLHRFNEHWPAGTGIRGWLDGHAQVTLADEGPLWQAEFRSDDGHLLYAEIEDELETFPYGLRLSSRGDATEWQADGEFIVDEQGTVRFDVAINPEDDQRLRGEVNARFVDLSWLDMFANPASDIGGELEIDLDIGGVVSQPVMEGDIRLQQFTAYVAPLGIQLEDGHLQGRFHPTGLWEISGGIRSGEGSLSLDSTIDLSDPQNWGVEFATAGDRLLVIDTPEIRSLASADLRGRLNAERGIVNGRIGIAETRIRLVELPAGQDTITLSDDVVLYPPDDDVEAIPPYDLIANVDVVIEDEIDFEGYGLSARADGRLSAHYRTGRPMTAEGRFAVIEGRYRAYGQNLNIERGEVYFNGPLDNPAIDIRASRTIRDVTAGIQLGGRVQSLTSSIYSDPPMAPSDAMAFLLTGRPLSGASHEEANMLLSAVATLGVEHGEVITGGIQSAFGLDTFAIEGGETVQDTALVIGKNLTPKLLISYSEKLFERASTVTLSYELTRRTTVQAESGEGQSIDIIFEDELGR